MDIEQTHDGDMSQTEAISNRKDYDNINVSDRTQEDNIKEIQLLRRNVETMFAEKTALEKQLKKLENVEADRKQKEIDVEMKFSIEKANLFKQVEVKEKALKEANTDRANLLKQIKKIQEETVLNDGYKKEIIELGVKMLKSKCKQYDDEAVKNKILTRRIEQQKEEVTALQEATKDKTIVNNDIPVLRKSAEYETTKSGGLMIRNMTSLLEDGISSPFSRPQTKATVIKNEESDIEMDVYEGIVESLKQTKKHVSRTEIQQRYGELLENLVEKMPCNRDKVVRSLNRAFRTVLPDINFENAPGASLKQFVILESRKVIQQKTIQKYRK